MRIIASLLLLLVTLSAHAQEYRFRMYRVEQGLPSDVIKAVSQDAMGFIWIATDDGLVKYDGIKFTTYKSALRSQYAKSFLKTREGKLLVISDLDLIEIQNKLDTVVFKSLLRGARTPTDSTLWYPKSIYEDRHGILWLGESRSVTRYEDGKMKRFDFGDRNYSPVFTRSFSFFEDDFRNLYALSFTGKLFWYDRQHDRFVPLPDELPGDCAGAVFDKGSLWIASGTGLYQANIENRVVKNLTRVLPVLEASHLIVGPDSSIWVSSFESELYRVKIEGEKVTSELLPYKFNGINTSYRSYEGDIWSCTDKGLVLIQKNLFVLADELSQTHFIEGITYDEKSNSIYYCNKDELIQYQLDLSADIRRKVVYTDNAGYFQSIQSGDNGLWASNGPKVMLFENNKVVWEKDFEDEGNFVHDAFLDSQKMLWLSQAGNPNIISVSDSFRVTRYGVPGKRSEINIIREGPKGLYAGSGGENSYLFFKPRDGDHFTNISARVEFEVEGDFNIHDLTVQDNSVVWLASTEGLLRYKDNSLTRVNLGDAYTTLSVSSVEMLDDVNVLFSNSHGLFRYNSVTKEFWLYDENSGLPSNTITGRGIFIHKKAGLWIGTSFGIASALQSIIESSPTVKPYCVGAQVNGSSVLYTQGVNATYGSFINLEFSSITFPENKINLQWKMEGIDTAWRTVTNHQISLIDLPAGKHMLHVRAKKNTGLGWSTPAELAIRISKPFWQRPEFLFFVLTVILIIAWLSNNITTRVLNRRKEVLHKLIDERTKDLQHANEELTVRNNELDRFVYSASHDLSAPLKSLLGLISVSRMERPGERQTQYLNMMEGSVRKLEEFIRDVVSYSRNTRLPVKKETVIFSELVKDVMDDHQYSPNFSRIAFEVNSPEDASVTCDIMRLKIILNNLISNAIKFHRFDDKEVPFVRVSLSITDHMYIITVQDNGQGIDEQHTSRIFEMFYRASEAAQGSGLGLYILKETVSKMEGRVTVKSVADVGTTFTVMLPK